MGTSPRAGRLQGRNRSDLKRLRGRCQARSAAANFGPTSPLPPPVASPSVWFATRDTPSESCSELLTFPPVRVGRPRSGLL